MHGRWRGFGAALMLVGVLRPRSALLVLLVLFNFFKLRALRMLYTPSSTSRRTRQPRTPPAELTGDVAGVSSEVSSDPSRGGRPTVGCLGGLFA